MTDPQRTELGRVVHEDDDWMILEVAKHDNVEFRIQEGGRFYTLIFPAGTPWQR